MDGRADSHSNYSANPRVVQYPNILLEKVFETQWHGVIFQDSFIRHNFLSSAVFSFQNQLFFEELFQECHQCKTVWIQIRPVAPDLGQNCLEKVSADDTRTQINGHLRNITSFRLKRVY